LLVSTTV